MHKFKRVLVVVDPQKISNQNQAITRGLKLAKQNNAAITLLSVTQQPESSIREYDGIVSPQEITNLFKEKLLQALDELANPLRANGLEVNVEVKVGREFIEIIKLVLRKNIDIVIKVATLYAERLQGSDLHLIRKCPSPVWLIRASNSANAVLAAIDLKMQDGAEGKVMNKLILDIATTLANWDDAPLYMLSCWSLFGEDALRSSGFLRVPSQKLQHMLNTEKNVHQWRQKELVKGFELSDNQLVLIKGKPEVEIPKFVLQKQVSTVVMGTIGRTGVPGLIIGNTAETVLGLINSSVIAVKPEGFISPVSN